MSGSYRVIITPRAARDLEQIHRYISLDAPLSADDMVGKILDAFEPLKTFPSRMIVIAQSARLKEPVRSLSVRPFIVYFRLNETKKAVEILHIRHAARKPPRNLK